MSRFRVGLILLATTAIGCGIPIDQEPRALSTNAVEPTTQPVSESGDSSAFLFFVKNDRIVTATRDVASRSPTDVLTALLAKMDPIASAAGIVNQIPAGTRLLGAQQLGSALNVNLSSEFDNLVGTGRTQATAQIVFTATDLTGIETLTFSIDGKPTMIVSPAAGDTSTVTACDFRGLLPTDDEVQEANLSTDAGRHLLTLRNRLDARCV